MRYLLYCIFSSSTRADSGMVKQLECQDHETPAGIGGRPVFLVSNKGLTAALSDIVSSDNKEACSISAPKVSQLLDYEKIVELFHLDRTVIPMRYGCLFEKESDVLQLLEERCQQYEALLKDLEGCVEMGIRVLISDCDAGTAENGSPNTRPEILAQHTSKPGRNYLNDRMVYYTREERSAEKNSLVIERCQAAFAGLFLKCKPEYSSNLICRSIINNHLLSLYFLVPRRSVDSFRMVFRQLCLKESTKLLLSGPWPPYNFVLACGEFKNGS